MGLSTGIIGLPNVGKSTLFNAITNSQVEAANYPFATIEPNVGIVSLPDNRLEQMALLINPDKIMPATCQFVDIAGLVKGASKGEGLGNKFLQNIREVDAICHVVRCFKDKSITHVHDGVDPIRDIGVINLELIMADLEIMSKRLHRIKKKAESGDKESKNEVSLLTKIVNCLESGKLVSDIHLHNEEIESLSSYNLLTLKPILYIANIGEDEIGEPDSNEYYRQLEDYCKDTKNKLVPISAKIEYEISQLNPEDKNIFMEDLSMSCTGLDKVIRSSFELLNLATYFTFGKKEVRAWTFHKGMTAPQCAGIIHTDFERGFIKAEIMKYEDLVALKNELAVKVAGKMRLEGKTYLMQDGDVCNFKFNV